MKLSFKKISLPLCALALACASLGASAATVQLKENGFRYGHEAIRVDVNPGSGTNFQAVDAGGVRMTVNSDPTNMFGGVGSILAWCIELAQDLSSSNTAYSASVASSQSWVGSLTALVNQRYQQVLSAADSIASAAMQLAIWEVVSGGTNLANGNFQATALLSNYNDSLAAVNLAQSWLNALGNANTPAPGNYQIVVLEHGTSQDLVTFQEVAAVPLPGAALLFLSALGVSGVARRKRAAKEEVAAA